MQKSRFLAPNDRAFSKPLDTAFVGSARQHAIAEGCSTAYVVPVSLVMSEPVETDEICVVIVMAELESEGIEFGNESVTPQVRTRADGTPIACALLANGRVAVNAHALTEAQPLHARRLTVLWIFQNCCALCMYPYGEDTEEWFWAASMVADGHRHETDYAAREADENTREEHVIEVFNYYKIGVPG